MTRPSIQREGEMDICLWSVHTTSRTIQILTLVCALCDNVRIGPVLDVTIMNSAGLHYIEVLIPPKKNLQNCSRVLISKSLNQHHTQFGGIRCWRSTTHAQSVKKIPHRKGKPCASNEQKNQQSHRQETPCAYLTKVPQPSDRRKTDHH